eukprot:GHVU01086191.1.p4 GENE.GHVU01086191.1~~GHVU01086191.1.p4  ORF type:complete len:105 (-),score=24.64 GHVU01086191.1:6-320(-)
MIGHDRFLRAAELFGGDQFIISALFPSYTGKQIKEKFKKEERLRPNLFREWIAQRPKGGAAGAKERAADMLAFFQEVRLPAKRDSADVCTGEGALLPARAAASV